MTQNKFHWYDGWFYDKILAPHQTRLFTEIINLIEPDKKVIDIGCGTGYFDFMVSSKCRTALGIDISQKNIKQAKSKLAKYPDSKVNFIHSDFRGLDSTLSGNFNYAVLTYVLHEINEADRIPLILDIASKTDYIIIGDFLIPHPNRRDKILTNMIEFVAGWDHYSNFRTYKAKGGLDYLVEKSGLIVHTEIKNQPSGTHIVKLIKPSVL